MSTTTNDALDAAQKAAEAISDAAEWPLAPERSPLEAGNRIRVGREYGIVRLVTAHNVWYHADDGRCRFAPLAGAERVHGNRHRTR